MIYNRGYRRTIASKQLKSGGLTFFKNIASAFVSVILTALVHFGLVILARDDSAAVSSYLFTTYYGTLYIYTFISFIVVFFQLLIKVWALCFQEISSNRWNLLTSMGIPVSGLVGAKIGSTLFALIRQYLIGYLLTMFCGYLFGFEFHINYIVALFFAGSINLILLYMVPTALSVFVKRSEKARVNLFLGMLFVVVLNLFSGFYHFEGTLNSESHTLADMFAPKFTAYIAVAAAVFTVCYAVILVVAKTRSLRQELMPLSVFEIRPLVSGSETELFMTDGVKHTTILDTEILREQRDDPAASLVEKPNMQQEPDEAAAFPYGLLITISAAVSALSGVFAGLSLLLPDGIRPIFAALLGTGFASSLTTPAGAVILGVLAAAFAAGTVFLILKRKQELMSEDG